MKEFPVKGPHERLNTTMIIVPCYNLLLLPDITYHFQGEYFSELSGTRALAGQELLFLILKSDVKRRNVESDDIRPIGLRAVVDSIDRNGNVDVKTKDRVSVLGTDISFGEISAEIVSRPIVNDADPRKLDKRFREMRASVLKLCHSQPWGMLARNAVMQWQNMQEMIVMLSGFMNLNAEDRYAMLAADQMSLQADLIEKALYGGLEA